MSLAWSPDGSLIAMTKGLSKGTGETRARLDEDRRTNSDDAYRPSPQPARCGLVSGRNPSRVHGHLRQPPHDRARRLASADRSNRQPRLNIAFSPSGDQIAFVGDKGDLSVLDLETGVHDERVLGPRRSIGSGSDPRGRRTGPCSPSRCSRKGRSSINIVNADGTGFRQAPGTLPSMVSAQPGRRTETGSRSKVEGSAGTSSRSRRTARPFASSPTPASESSVQIGERRNS